MSKIAYEKWTPRGESLAVVEQAEAICLDYARQGYDLTLRQLYYQFVARDLIPNNQQSYKRLGSIVDHARLAGLLDWDHIVDRTRNLMGVSHWSTPASVIRSAAASYRIDKWTTQPTRVEVWVEKEALAGVIGRTSRGFDVDYFSCRGYVSQSEMWAAARRLLGYIETGQRVVVLHLGDHDPSGLDMTRDITDRLEKFVYTDWYRDHYEDIEKATYEAIIDDIVSTHEWSGGDRPLEVRRIALNMDQVEEYDPPPNFAKITDSRAKGYLAEFGESSWELDALDPAVLDELISSHIEGIRDAEAYEERVAVEAFERRQVESISDNYEEIIEQFGSES